MAGNYLTLTRQALYDLVWSRPMVDVARDFHVSDVALAKRCKAVDVPVPPRGWWAKQAAGQNPPKTPLPKYRVRSPVGSSASESYEEVVREGAEPKVQWKVPKPAAVAATSTISPEHSEFDGRLNALSIDTPLSLTDPAGPIKRTALLVGVARVKDFRWSPGEREGPIVDIQVSDAQRDRALRILDGLIRAASSLGWHFVSTDEDPRDRRDRWPKAEDELPKSGFLQVEGERFAVRITEANRRSDHVLTAREKLEKERGQLWYTPKWDFTPSGVLTLRLLSTRGLEFKAFRESVRRPLQARLRDVLTELYERSQKEKLWREEQRLEEERRQRREELRRQAQERRDAQKRLISHLERQAGAWYRARLLRRYLHAARKAVGDQKVPADLGGVRVDFLGWADAYVEQLDPLGKFPTHPDQSPVKVGYYMPDASEALNRFLQRVTGSDGVAPWKLIAEVREGTSDEFGDAEEDDDSW